MKDDEIELTDVEKGVLYMCDEEPAGINLLKKEFEKNYPNCEIKKILATLGRQGLIYEEDNIWTTTLKGTKHLNS